MKKTKTIYLNVRVDFEYDEMTMEEDAVTTAISLAVNPNYNTIEEGVHLDEVTTNLIENE